MNKLTNTCIDEIDRIVRQGNKTLKFKFNFKEKYKSAKPNGFPKGQIWYVWPWKKAKAATPLCVQWRRWYRQVGQWRHKGRRRRPHGQMGRGIPWTDERPAGTAWLCCGPRILYDRIRHIVGYCAYVKENQKSFVWKSKQTQTNGLLKKLA